MDTGAFLTPLGLTQLFLPQRGAEITTAFAVVLQRPAGPMAHLKSFALEHQLQAHDDFIELVITSPRMRGAEVRPRVNVISHHFDRIAVDVVIEPSRNGVDAVAAHLSRV